MEKKLKQIERDIQKYETHLWKDYSKVEINKNPIKRRFLGIPIPVLRKFLNDTKGSGVKMIDEISHFFKNTQINEVQTWCVHRIESFTKEDLLQTKKHLLELIDYCDNWWISDALSSTYAKILEADANFLTVLKKWNTDTNLWKRRQSVVSLFYYSSLRKSHQKFEDAIVLVKNLLHDKEYYVQKWVGWTLRELYNVYPEKTIKFIEENVKYISAHAWQASTEKLEKKLKENLKAKRKRWISPL